jgi:hypothetical protein
MSAHLASGSPAQRSLTSSGRLPNVKDQDIARDDAILGSSMRECKDSNEGDFESEYDDKSRKLQNEAARKRAQITREFEERMQLLEEEKRTREDARRKAEEAERRRREEAVQKRREEAEQRRREEAVRKRREEVEQRRREEAEQKRQEAVEQQRKARPEDVIYVKAAQSKIEVRRKQRDTMSESSAEAEEISDNEAEGVKGKRKGERKRIQADNRVKAKGSSAGQVRYEVTGVECRLCWETGNECRWRKKGRGNNCELCVKRKKKCVVDRLVYRPPKRKAPKPMSEHGSGSEQSDEEDVEEEKGGEGKNCAVKRRKVDDDDEESVEEDEDLKQERRHQLQRQLVLAEDMKEFYTQSVTSLRRQLTKI